MSMAIDEHRPLPIMLWALVLGVTGFATGFFGPMTLVPEANQGPLLGIFITGPAGAALGIILGVVFRFLPFDRTLSVRTLVVATGLLAVVTLYYSMPEPRIVGYALDTELEGCTAPEASAPQAIQHWERRIADAPWAKAREGWKKNAPRMLRDSGGVVLHLRVLRTTAIREHRKPWNRGYIDTAGWQTGNESRTFYARYAGNACQAYGARPAVVYYDAQQTSSDWPPIEPGGFLDMITVRPIPANVRRVLAD